MPGASPPTREAVARPSWSSDRGEGGARPRASRAARRRVRATVRILRESCARSRVQPRVQPAAFNTPVTYADATELRTQRVHHAGDSFSIVVAHAGKQRGQCD